MALNARKVKSNPKSGNKVVQPHLDAGPYPARLVQVVDLGIQTQDPYQGQEKPPVQEIRLTYELLDEFCLDEDGNEMEDKPRFLSEEIPFRSLEADLAKSTKRYYALDPEEAQGGDFTALIGTPCVVVVTTREGKGRHAGRTFNNIGNVATMRAKDAAKAPELINEPLVFLLDEPNLEEFERLPEFIRDKIKNNLEYNGSPLQALLEGKKEAPKEVQEVPEENEAEEEGGWV